ncbi:MAG: contractile injection system protein, VgrG/Pvc8 family [Rhodobacter sp.]|nr:contractile injection system protein, VgrG/Pvc8 family [Rhodobacter sp.]
MTPAFAITADGADATAAIGDRLLSLRVTDQEGITSDRLEIEIDNRDLRVAMPEHGALLEVSLGFRETGLTRLGSFVVDSTGGSGPELRIRIGAKAADMAGSIRAPKTRAWEDASLEDIVSTIAGEVGLEPVVGDSIKAVRFPFVAQSAESDLHLLTRLALPLDATAKPADGRLLVVRRGEGKTAGGQALKPVAIVPAMLLSWDFEIADRGLYKSVEAEWADTGAAETRKVTAGDGTPVRKLRRVFSSETEAQAAADAALARSERGVSSLDVELATFEPALFAGGLVDPKGLGDALAGTWHLKSVAHVLDGDGLRSEFRAERGQE